jgi:glycosyltransferase involved in cell wall biosynthesis
MRILTATQNRSVIGGAETYLRAVLPLLRDRGYEVGLVCARPAVPGHPAIDDDCPGLAVRMVSDPAGALAAAEAFRPDVVWDHGLADPAVAAVLARRFPAVLYAHVYNGTCVSGTKCQAFPAPRACGRVLGPACLALYLPKRCGGLSPRTMWAAYRTQRARQANLPAFRSVMVASRHMAAEYRRHAVPDDRVHLVPYFLPGVAPDPDPPVPRPRTDRVLFVGRLTRIKGGDHLIEALPRAAAELGRTLKLIVAGDGPDRPRLEALAARRGIAAEFRGWLAAGEREAVTRGVDLLAVPSLWPEPFGLVGIEAGAVGVPAAGYAVGGIPDWLAPGDSGEAAPFDPPDPHALAKAIARVLADDAHWNRLRRGAWEAARRFTPDRHLDRLEVVLRSVVGL